MCELSVIYPDKKERNPHSPSYKSYNRLFFSFASDTCEILREVPIHLPFGHKNSQPIFPIFFLNLN